LIDVFVVIFEIDFNIQMISWWLLPFDLPIHLKDKIFEIKYDSNETISKIISYFPFNEIEKQEIVSILDDGAFVVFNSIFTDTVSDEEWNRTKDQIKKKFKDELFDIDDV
jgi:hypothetical protein